jgi:hypothetical protein
MFVRFAIVVLLATQSVAGASNLLRNIWDENCDTLEKAVERGKARFSSGVISLRMFPCFPMFLGRF